MRFHKIRFRALLDGLRRKVANNISSLTQEQDVKSTAAHSKDVSLRELKTQLASVTVQAKDAQRLAAENAMALELALLEMTAMRRDLDSLLDGRGQ